MPLKHKITTLNTYIKSTKLVSKSKVQKVRKK